MARRKPTDWREARRLRAWELKQAGWKQRRIAEALGVTPGAVSQWIKKAMAEGVTALHSRKGGGPKPRLSDEQLQRMPALLDQGAEVHGFRGDVWTRPRIAKVIEREYRVCFTPQHVGNLMRKLGWSRQKPISRASQRDESAIEQWRTETWPVLKKSRTRGANDSLRGRDWLLSAGSRGVHLGTSWSHPGAEISTLGASVGRCGHDGDLVPPSGQILGQISGAPVGSATDRIGHYHKNAHAGALPQFCDTISSSQIRHRGQSLPEKRVMTNPRACLAGDSLLRPSLVSHRPGVQVVPPGETKRIGPGGTLFRGS
jgi:transposase